MKLSKTLEPLEPLKHKINVIHGLFNKRATGQGIHPAQTGSLLSGAHDSEGRDHQGGHHRRPDDRQPRRPGHARSPSIVLACEQPMTGYHETNFSMAYSSHISWQSPDSPVPNEVYPSLALDNLFENRGSLRNMSILDRVKDDADGAHAARSAPPTRPSWTSISPACAKWRSASTACARTRTRRRTWPSRRTARCSRWTGPANGLPEDLREHARLMCDIIAIAFQTDKTRVASLLLARDLSALYYPFLEVKRRAPRRVAQQQLRRLRAHRALPPEPARVSGVEAGQHAGRRRHGARQLVPDVPLEHVDRPQARQHADCRWCSPAGWAARSRPGRTLDYLQRRRRQSEDVQPVPLAHGSHGREARPVRRRRDAPARHLISGLRY